MGLEGIAIDGMFTPVPHLRGIAAKLNFSCVTEHSHRHVHRRAEERHILDAALRHVAPLPACLQHSIIEVVPQRIPKRIGSLEDTRDERELWELACGLGCFDV